MKFFKLILDIFTSWKSYNRSMRELNKMTDIELRDMGLSRGDIHRVAATRSF